MHQKCPGGRREIVSDNGGAVLVTCKCGRHPAGPERVKAVQSATKTEVGEMKNESRIVAVNANGAYRVCGRPDPTTATDRELVEALNAPGSEHVLALKNEVTGRVAFVKSPVAYFDKAEYERRMQKQRHK